MIARYPGKCADCGEYWPEGTMSRTTRHAYDGQPIRDGQHGRRCPSAHCEWCSKARTRRQKPQPEEDQ